METRVALSLIFGDGDTAGLTPIRQWAMPNDGKGSIHLRQRESLVLPNEGIVRIGGSLLVPLLLKSWVVRPPVKEIPERFVQVTQGLLQRHRRNIIEPNRLFLLLEQDQTLCSTFVVHALTTLIVGISTLAQCPVLDIAATPKGLCQNAFLFIAGRETILVGFLLFHTLQYSILHCKV